MDGINWPEAGPSSALMAQVPAPMGLAAPAPITGPSSVTLNSPQFAVPQLPSSDPSPSSRGRGSRGRGRGLRGVGRGRGRGRGAQPGGAGPGRQSGRTRISTRSGGDGGTGRLKLSLKMNGQGIGEAAGGTMDSFLGEYDRELDENPEEPLEFEEQFILRVPKEVADGKKGGMGLREMIKGKGLEALEMKFLDSRRAAVKIGGATYSSKLVDLPCIIESQKTHDSRHLFKVADISQMLVLGPQVASEANIPSGAINQDDYIWPHGITPPLRHVRKRRFRKRLSRRMIEVVEEQVEELIAKDNEAESSSYDALDPDIPDSYYADYDPNVPWQGYNPSEGSYGDPGSVMPSEAPWEEGEDEDAEGEDDGLDEDLVNAMREEISRSEQSEDEDGFEEGDADDADEAGEDEDEDGEEDDEETAAKKAKIRQFASEIKQLEAAIEKKRAGFQGGNIIMVKRFEETIAGMMNDINNKAVARQVLVDEVERAKPVAEAVNEDVEMPAAPGGAAAEPAPFSDEEDDLFGEEEEDDVSAEEEATGPDTPRSQYVDMEPDSPAIMGPGAEEDVQTDGEEQLAEGTEEYGEGEDDDEDEADENDEMAAMLAAELGGQAEVQDQTDAMEAIDAMVLEDGLEKLQGGDGMMPSSPAMDQFAPDFSTREGGVGMRRLVEGAEEDDSGDSDDSDD